jgi:hypothetical protein
MAQEGGDLFQVLNTRSEFFISPALLPSRDARGDDADDFLNLSLD